MGQQCRTCAHPSRREIERLREGGTTLEDLSAAFGLTVSTINRHLNNPKCRARCEAVECAPEAAQAVAGRLEAPDRPAAALAPPMRRRAIAGVGRTQGSMQPVARPNNDRGSPAMASIVPFYPQPSLPVSHQSKSSLPTNPQELALLHAIGYNVEQIADLLGGGASAVADVVDDSHGKKRSLGSVTRPQWANECIRLRVDFLFSLRRQQQLAMDDRQHRVARQYNVDIDRAMTQLFKTLELFGLIGPIDPSEVSKEGEDVREQLQIALDIFNGKLPPELTPEEELRFLEAEGSAAA